MQIELPIQFLQRDLTFGDQLNNALRRTILGELEGTGIHYSKVFNTNLNCEYNYSIK